MKVTGLPGGPARARRVAHMSAMVGILIAGLSAAALAAEPEPAAAPAAESGGLFEQGVAASGAAAKANDASPSAGATELFKINGYTRGDAFVGKVSGANRATTRAAYGEGSLTLRTAKGEHGDGFAETRVRTGQQGEENRTFLDVREAYVNAYFGPVDLRLGQQIIVWGRADAFNPTNNLTPVDFTIRSPLEDDIRLGNVGARSFIRLAPFRLEGVWMPIYQPTQLPLIGLPKYVSYGPTLTPAPDIPNGLGAARLHLELPGIEASVSYLQGFAPLPGLTITSLKLTGTTDPPPSVVVSRTRYRHDVVGMDFSTAIGDLLTIRGEAAYRRPILTDKLYVPHPDLQYVLGADHAFGSVSVIAQYMGRYVFDWHKENGSPFGLGPDALVEQTDEGTVTKVVNLVLAKTNQILFSQTAQIQHLATLRAEWLGAHDAISVSALGMVNFTTQEWLFTPRIGYRVSDQLTTYIGAQIFHGPDDTLFGLIENELSSGYAELRYTF